VLDTYCGFRQDGTSVWEKWTHRPFSCHTGYEASEKLVEERTKNVLLGIKHLQLPQIVVDTLSHMMSHEAARKIKSEQNLYHLGTKVSSYDTVYGTAVMVEATATLENSLVQPIDRYPFSRNMYSDLVWYNGASKPLDDFRLQCSGLYMDPPVQTRQRTDDWLLDP
jgi:hypothetical protein